jgi:hypothetical protein
MYWQSRITAIVESFFNELTIGNPSVSYCIEPTCLQTQAWPFYNRHMGMTAICKMLKKEAPSFCSSKRNAEIAVCYERSMCGGIIFLLQPVMCPTSAGFGVETE